VAFRFLAGYQVTVFFLGDRVAGYAGLTASINLWRGSDDPQFAIGINLVALLVIIALARIPSPSSPGDTGGQGSGKG
jgi:hypothetical protein